MLIPFEETDFTPDVLDRQYAIWLMESVLTLREAAALVHRHPKTIMRRVDRRDLPFRKTEAGILVPRAFVLALYPEEN